MINQRAYPDIKLGNSNYSIATDGCYLCSIHQGLKLRGYNFSIAQLNQLFKDRGVFPPNSALLSAATIAARVGDIFLEGRNEAWNDQKLVQYLNDPNYFVVGEVSGKGIGGQYQHFVYIDRVDVKPDGKIGMTWIDDPWDGLEDQKVTTRYNAYGNILSLRVFKITKGADMANWFTMKSGNKVDLSNMDSNKVLAQTHDDVVNLGLYIRKSDVDARIQTEVSKATDEKNRRILELEKQLRERPVVEKVVEKTVEVVVEKPVYQEVIKVVEKPVEKIVEVTKEVKVPAEILGGQQLITLALQAILSGRW